MCEAHDYPRKQAVQNQMCQFCQFRKWGGVWEEVATLLRQRNRHICHKTENTICRGHFNQARGSYVNTPHVFVDNHASDRRKLADGDAVILHAEIEGRTFKQVII